MCRLVAIRGFMFMIVQQLRAAPSLAGSVPQLQQESFSQASSSQASLSQMPALSVGGGGLTLLQVG